MTIKHLVISGGGLTGLLAYGIVSHLAKKGFWQLADIKSIYGCSIGAFVGVILSLNYEWEWLDDYFIKRPWEKLIASSITPLIDIYEKKCLFNEHFFKEAISPLLRAKDLSDTITLQEFYDYNQIDIHMYATNINGTKLAKVDLSYKTHPDLSLIKALRMTMAYPIVFEPICEAAECYIDGGLLNNFPLNDCIVQQKCEMTELLALKNMWQNVETPCITSESSILDFLLVILKKMQETVNTEFEQIDTIYTVKCLTEDIAGMDKWSEALKSEELRRTIIEKGFTQADLFLAELPIDDHSTEVIN